MNDAHEKLVQQINEAIKAGTFSLNALKGVSDLKARAEGAERGLQTAREEKARLEADVGILKASLASAAEREKRHGDLVAREQKIALVELELKLRTEFGGKMENILLQFLKNPVLKYSGYDGAVLPVGPTGSYGSTTTLSHERKQEIE